MQKLLILKSIYKKIPILQPFFIKISKPFFNFIPKFSGWGMKTGHELPWNDNYNWKTFRDSHKYIQEHFNFSNDGIGMNKNDITRVFEKFARGEEGFKSHTEGTGLGLFVAKRVVEVHGGDIWAGSDGPGKGSRFIFTLPLTLKEKPKESGMETLVKKELEKADNLEEKK